MATYLDLAVSNKSRPEQRDTAESDIADSTSYTFLKLKTDHTQCTAGDDEIHIIPVTPPIHCQDTQAARTLNLRGPWTHSAIADRPPQTPVKTPIKAYNNAEHSTANTTACLQSP